MALLLTACAELPPAEEHPVARPPRARIAAYTVSARVAARHEQTRHHATIAWRHAPDADEILLTGPLGQGIAEIGRDARGARLVTADKRIVEAADWEELSERVFGFALPLAGLPRWLVGDVETTARDQEGRPLAARAHGWDIRYLAYESRRADALPVLIELDRDGETEVRLKVDAWQLE